jgi:hypothetical protein
MTRHTVVMALAGWYLISPGPLEKSNGGFSPVLIDVERRLSEWGIRRSFDTVGKCQAYLNDWIIEQRAEAEKLPRPASAQVLLELNTRSNSRCIASDDPGLSQ